MDALVLLFEYIKARGEGDPPRLKCGGSTVLRTAQDMEEGIMSGEERNRERRYEKTIEIGKKELKILPLPLSNRCRGEQEIRREDFSFRLEQRSVHHSQKNEREGDTNSTTGTGA